MESIKYILDINFHIFKIFGYPLSLIEFVGTIFGLLSVWLATKANIHTWTTAFINVSAFFIIYYQVQLYSDMFLQVFFFASSMFGLWQWLKRKPENLNRNISIQKNKFRIFILALLIITSFALGKFVSEIHNLFPETFPHPSGFPYADAVTTTLSITATFLMAYKKLECWILWILVDIISIYLYIQKDIMFVAFEFAVFLVMSIYGLIHWINYIRNEKRISLR